MEMVVLAEISTKVILLLKKKESSVSLLVVQIHFMVPMVSLRACTSSSFRRIRTEDADGTISSNVSMGKMAFFVTNSTVVCSKHLRKEDLRKTLTGRWEIVSGLSSKDYIHLSLHFLLITLISISPPHCFYRILCLLVVLFQLIFQ